MPYAVTTPVFAGPFDLLLHLILQEEVDLYEVSLSAIVDAYFPAMDDLEDRIERSAEILAIDVKGRKTRS